MTPRRAEKHDRLLAETHEYLTATKAQLMAGITARLRAQREGSRDDCLDSCDLASEENDREMSNMLSEREQLKLGQIDDALRRVASRTYGLCETCGLEIAAERLKATPFTRLCCDCQRERETKTRRRYLPQAYEGYDLGSTPEQGESGDALPMGRGGNSVMDLFQTERGRGD